MVEDSQPQLADQLVRFRPWGEAAMLERVLNRLAEQSAGNRQLRQELQENTVQTLAGRGIYLPPTMRVVWHEQRPGHCDLVLPLAELSAEDWSPQVYAVLRRAADDAAFAAELLARPKAAIESALGLRLPSTVQVTAWRNSLAEIHVILPEDDQASANRGEATDESADELSDAELELIAGGGAGMVPWLRWGGRKAKSAD